MGRLGAWTILFHTDLRGDEQHRAYWTVFWHDLIPRYGGSSVSIQATLWEDGSVSLCYPEVAGVSGAAGIMKAGHQPYPEQINLAPSPEEGDLCINGRDDDLDGATDCDDASCAGTLQCERRDAYYQNFDTEYVDLRVHTVTFVPDGQGSYQTHDATAGTPYWITPGSTSSSRDLQIPPGGGVWDDLGFDFPYYYGRTYRSVFVHSDGFISFDGFGDTDYWINYPLFFDHPIIAALWSTRLEVDEATVDTGTDADTQYRFWALTVSSHRSQFSSERLDYQLVLFENGTVRISYSECFDGMGGMAGLSGGGRVGVLPEEQDLVVPEEHDASACANGMDDDADGQVDCDDRDCDEFCALWPYESFTSGSDLEGHVLFFEPKPMGNGFSWYAGDATDFFVEPTQEAVHDFSTYDDDNVFTWQLPFSFPYKNVDRNTIWISTNGWISFVSESSSRPWASVSTLFSRDMVAVAWDDLQCSSQTSLTVHEGTDDDGRQWTAVTWYRYVDFYGNYVSVQVVLLSDGEIRMYYPQIRMNSLIVGTGHDNGGNVPPEQDLIP